MMAATDDFAAANRDEIVDLLARLISQDTANPPGNEHRAARVVMQVLRPLGVECRIFEKEAGRTNVIARLGSGRTPHRATRSRPSSDPTGPAPRERPNTILACPGTGVEPPGAKPPAQPQADGGVSRTGR